MNRRDFLQPRRLAHSAGQMLGALEPVADDSGSSADVLLLHLRRRAMATNFEIILPFDTPSAVQMGEKAFDLLDKLEEQMTVYRNSSEISRLNQWAFAGPVRVERRLFGLLELAAQIHRETEGAYDITAGALIKAWGFFRGPRRVPSEEEREAARQRVGMDKLTLDAEHLTVRYQRPGIEINLGSIGKGYALDRMARLLRGQWGCRRMLLQGGTSSVYAGGSPDEDESGWQVAIVHPWNRRRRLARVWLRNRALGTSAATHQHLEYNGKKLGHLLDPRTGWPACSIASASVLAPSAAETDALSTAFYVGGLELAQRYCAVHPGIAAILLPEGEGAEPVAIGLAAHELSWN
ncbi:MAG TPA: FAD:protein FMN transferase [Gemmataceae bacterium]|nr:FAD:protein FMN transferase [Gemmataceae bacterium]